MSLAVGLDFGTTNSAVAVCGPEGDVALARFPSAEGETTTFRSVLFFDPEEHGPGRRPLAVAGPRAIERYLAAEGEGRLIQSLKSYLASRTFKATSVYGFNYTLEDLVALLARDLARAAGSAVRIVCGRPVVFAGAETADDESFAIERLRASLARAGLPDVEMEYEPVGAAYHYEQGLDHDELVLIADFGGGTSDFCLVRVGPTASRTDRILGTEGIPIAGDVFDSRIVRHLVAPRLGRGSSYRTQSNKLMPVPPWLHTHLERWHHLSFLKSRETMHLLEMIADGAVEPEQIRAFIHVVDSDLGHQLYRAVERTKVELSAQSASRFRFRDGPVDIDATVTRAEFEGWIADDTARIAACVDRLLARTAVAPSDVDRVFMTGGSAFVPAVRRLFADRFGAERLRGGDELTSVASGLALRARDAVI